MTSSIKNKFAVENPQVEVAEVLVPEFNPGIMAQQLVQSLENGVHFRRACHNMLSQIMRKGALGAMIIISGKMSGARARSERFKAGYIRYCGEPTLEYVKEATTYASLKPGMLGVKVKIMPPIDNPNDALGLRKIPLIESTGAAPTQPAPAAVSTAERKVEAHVKRFPRKRTANPSSAKKEGAAVSVKVE